MRTNTFYFNTPITTDHHKLKTPYLVYDDYSNDISHEQRESVSRALTEAVSMYCAHDVRVLINELEEVLQAPAEALAETHDAFSERVFELLKFVVDPLQDYADYSNYGYDQRSQGNGTQVIPVTCFQEPLESHIIRKPNDSWERVVF